MLKIKYPFLAKALVFCALMLFALVSCSKENNAPAVSLTLSGVPEKMEIGVTAEISVTPSSSDKAFAYNWMSLNPSVVSITADGDKAAIKALQGGRATILVYLKDNEAVNARAVVEVEKADDGILRILAIGNSFSQDAVEQYLYELFEAGGQKTIIGNLYIGGCSLEKHYNNINNDAAAYEYRKVVDGVKTNTKNMKISTVLAEEDWDCISIQQVSGLSGKIETVTPYLPQVLNYVRSHSSSKVKILWHSTWAYAATSNHADFPKYNSDQMTMFNAITEVGKTVMADKTYAFDLLIPSGTAIQNGRTSSLGDRFNRDGYHLETTYGRYTAACTWFEAISGKNVEENSWAPSSVDAEKAKIARTSAHNAVAHPYVVTAFE